MFVYKQEEVVVEKEEVMRLRDEVMVMQREEEIVRGGNIGGDRLEIVWFKDIEP